MTDKQIEPPTESDIEEADGMASADAKEEGVDEVDWREALPAAEFCCWVVVLLAPMLRLVNGAAVTDDQFNIQVGLVTLALSGAVILRIVNGRRVRRYR